MNRSAPVLLVVTTLAVAAQDLRAQAVRTIEILEPAAWRSDATRGIVVRQKRGLRVVGIARSAAGIDRVTLNGADAALTGAGDEVRFVGYAAPATDTEEVEVEVWVGNQVLASARYAVTVEAADETFDDPATAWTEASGFSGERWAVVIGISEYADRSVPALRYADDDARAFRDFLLSPASGMGGFEPENIRFLTNEQATYRDIRLAFRDFLKAATDDDVVYIFFAGHGAPDPERPQDLYLLAHDTDVASIAATGFPMSEVTEAIRRTYARTIVSFIDACHSAGVSGDVGLRAIENPINQLFLDRVGQSLGVQVTFTASQVSQFSQEGPQWGGGHGVFTHFLLRGLQGEADEDGDGIVTLGESLEWTRDRVRRETRNGQIPSISQTAFDPSWPMSIGGGPAFAVQQPVANEPAATRMPEATTGRGAARTTPAVTPPPQSAAGAEQGMLVLVYGDGDPASLAEEALLRSLRTVRGVRPMDALSLGLADRSNDAVEAAAAGDFAALADMMRAREGEFLLVGSLTTDARPAPIGTMVSGSAELELRLYRVSTGEIVQSGTFGVGTGGEPARVGATEADARSQAAQTAARAAAAAARTWLARVLR